MNKKLLQLEITRNKTWASLDEMTPDFERILKDGIKSGADEYAIKACLAFTVSLVYHRRLEAKLLEESITKRTVKTNLLKRILYKLIGKK